jgi:prophage antirepressor-like protein
VTAVEVYRAPSGQDIRTVLVDGEPWFIAADICSALDIANPRDAVRQLDDDESDDHVVDNADTLITKIVSEAGLYSLILRSRKPEAKVFKRWVTHDVLPAIRHTGSYSAPVALPQTYADALRELATTVEQRDAAIEQVAVLEPKAELAARVLEAAGDFSVADAAKILSRDPAVTIGRDRLFTYLGQLGWTYRQQGDGRWRPKQVAIEARRLSELAGSHYHPRTGELVLDVPQIRVTPKGLLELHRRLGGAVALAIHPELVAS